MNLSMAYAKNKQVKQAKDLMNECISEWAGTEYESIVVISNADIMIMLGDVKKAIDILRNVD